jgi:ABC-2 type transport system ATP-binding protein
VKNKALEMIRIQNLSKAYKDKIVLSIPSLEVLQGQMVGLVGNNGAGKSTLLHLILDLIEPTSGTVFSNEINVSESEEWKKYTGSYLNESFLIPYLTSIEYFDFIGHLHGWSKSDVDNFLESCVDFFNCNEYRKVLIRDLSAGNRNKVGLLGCLIGSPKLLLLDEPFSFLDPTSQSWLKNKLKKLHEEGVTMLISSHDLLHITEISSRMLVIEKGVIIKDFESTPDTLKDLESYFDISDVLSAQND